jgi:LmbE family N-acetylglucosaminyl deacetylase
MANVLIVAPHPDDETFGAGGTLLRHRAKGDQLHWCIVTGLTEGAPAFGALTGAHRNRQIADVTELFGFVSVHSLDFPAARLSDASELQLVSAISNVVACSRPEYVYVCHAGDVHGDHRVVSQAVLAGTKWFRNSSVRRVVAYETLSETDAAAGQIAPPFVPNLYVDISPWLDRKLDAIQLYHSELQPFPFPRSPEAVVALARVRGAAAGFPAAEGFMLLRERWGLDP